MLSLEQIHFVVGEDNIDVKVYIPEIRVLFAVTMFGGVTVWFDFNGELMTMTETFVFLEKDEFKMKTKVLYNDHTPNLKELTELFNSLHQFDDDLPFLIMDKIIKILRDNFDTPEIHGVDAGKEMTQLIVEFTKWIGEQRWTISEETGLWYNAYNESGKTEYELLEIWMDNYAD